MMLPCQKCGHDNELGRIFCFACGEKLDLNAVKPPNESSGIWKRAREHDMQKKGRGLGRRILSRVRWTLLLAMIAVLVLMFLPPAIKTFPKDATVASQASSKMSGLQNAMGRQRAETFSFTEAELNALIPDFKTDGGSAGFASFLPNRRQIEINDGQIVSVLKGSLGFGKALQLPMTVRLTGELNISGGKLNFEETGLHIGRLPIPRILFPAFGFLLNRIESFWNEEGIKNSRSLVGAAQKITVQSSTLVIEIAPSR